MSDSLLQRKFDCDQFTRVQPLRASSIDNSSDDTDVTHRFAFGVTRKAARYLGKLQRPRVRVQDCASFPRSHSARLERTLQASSTDNNVIPGDIFGLFRPR